MAEPGAPELNAESGRPGRGSGRFAGTVLLLFVLFSMGLVLAELADRVLEEVGAPTPIGSATQRPATEAALDSTYTPREFSDPEFGE